MRLPAAVSIFILTALLLAVLPGGGWAASSEDPDWPCIQRLVPRITAVQVWAGPEPDMEKARGDMEIGRLASKLAARRTPLDEAERLVEAFADAQPRDRVNEQLVTLFGQTLQFINRDRASIIAGIKRFAKRQRDLAERIRATRAELSQNDDAEDDPELSEQLTWDLRIFEEREQSMVYLCEQPVLLEQRAFALGRTVYFFVED